MPSDYVLNVIDEVSKYVAKKLGFSLEYFAAVLKKEQPVINTNIVEEVGYFATVTAQVLRRLGGEYAKFAEELEGDNKQILNFLWQEGNTRIYSFCTDEPWTLPFDALVIPTMFKIPSNTDFTESYNDFLAFKNFLGEEGFSHLYIAINRAKDENKQSLISPESPLIVSLPSKIKSQFPQIDVAQSNPCFILTTLESIESLEPSVTDAFKATQSIILKIAEQGITRLVIPLVGTGHTHLSINKVVIAMLSAITESLNNLSSNPLKEIIFVDKSESTIEIINQVANSLFNQKNIDDVQLLSAQGIDYTQLRDLLAAGKLEEADEETAKLMFKVADREEEEELRLEDIENFSYTDLQTIDQLWVKYSNGHFGFSVQKKIWQELGEQVNIETERKLGERTGWFNSDEGWLDYNDYTFSLDAPKGHLPASWDCWGIDDYEVHSTCYSNGRFGFSVQKQIYQSLGGTKEFNQKITEAFWHKVGLIINNEPYWSQYDNLTFNLSAPIGHLPIRYDVNTPAGIFGVIESLFSRPDLVLPKVENQQYEGKNEVTQAQWRIIANMTDIKVNIDLDSETSYFKGDDRPVETVNWYEAKEFCDRLSKLTGKQYRLPSEAEWEYACRAGTTTPFHFGECLTDELANYNATINYKNEPIGHFILTISVYMICTEIYGNGVKMTGTLTMKMHQTMEVPGWILSTISVIIKKFLVMEYYEEVAGMIALKVAVLLIVTVLMLNVRIKEEVLVLELSAFLKPINYPVKAEKELDKISKYSQDNRVQ